MLSSDHAAIDLRRTNAGHLKPCGREVVDIGSVTPESTLYPAHIKAAARRAASGDCALDIALCGPGQGVMMAANKVGASAAASVPTPSKGCPSRAAATPHVST